MADLKIFPLFLVCGAIALALTSSIALLKHKSIRDEVEVDAFGGDVPLWLPYEGIEETLWGEDAPLEKRSLQEFDYEYQNYYYPMETPTATTVTSTQTPTENLTDTPTQTLTENPTTTPTATPTGAPTSAPTTTETPNATLAATPTETPSATPTATETQTPTDRPTATPTGTPTATLAATPTETQTETQTATPTVIQTPTQTATPTETKTPLPTEPAQSVQVSQGAIFSQYASATQAFIQKTPVAVVIREFQTVQVIQRLRTTGIPEDGLDYLKTREAQQDVEDIRNELPAQVTFGRSMKALRRIRARRGGGNIYITYASLVVLSTTIVTPDFTLQILIARYTIVRTVLSGLNEGASAAASLQPNPPSFQRRMLEITSAPGTLIYDLSEKTLEAQAVITILNRLQEISKRDEEEFRSLDSTEREEAVTDAIGEMLFNLSYINSTETARISNPIVNGSFAVGVYYPSEEFQTAYAGGVAEVVNTDERDITVSAVLVIDDPMIEDSLYVIHTVNLQPGRCFLCQGNDPTSSETDSQSSSPSTKSSSESSVQDLLNPAVNDELYDCTLTGNVLFAGYNYGIEVTQIDIAMPCDRCGQFIDTCPEHASQLAVYEENIAVIDTFVGSEHVEASKSAGGDALIGDLEVPNRKVFYQNNGRRAFSSDFKNKTFWVGSTEIVLPIK